MYWYVLYVKTGREHVVESFLKNRLNINKFYPFVLLNEGFFKIAGNVKKELKPLFPSYVFIESQESGQELMKDLNDIIYSSNDIIRILRYSETEISIRETEKQLLIRLCNDNHCIKASCGIMEGDTIYITQGPLKGLESKVKKVNRHKRQAIIGIEFLGDIRLITVGLEILHKM